jgi:hypothetical protein
MDKILNGVEALTSKSGLLSNLVGLAERFVPQTEAAADVKCPGKCFRDYFRQCGSNRHARFTGEVVVASNISNCKNGSYTYMKLVCSRPCKTK